jgi:uncharacterized membrane protein
MGYRDEMDALRAQNASLESELSTTRTKLARVLKPTRSVDRSNPFLGGPLRLVRDLTFERALTLDDWEQIVRMLREELEELGQSEQLGKTFSWRTTGQAGRLVEVSCEVYASSSRLRIMEPLRPLAGAVYGGGLGGVGGGGMGIVIPVAARVGLIPLVAALWFAGVYLVARKIYASRVRRRASQLDRLLLHAGEVLGRGPDQA